MIMISEDCLSEHYTATMTRILVVEDERIIALNLKENLESSCERFNWLNAMEYLSIRHHRSADRHPEYHLRFLYRRYSP